MAATQKSKDPSPRKWLETYALYSGLVLQMGAIILIGTWLGHKADQHWGSLPWLTTFGAMGSLSIALYRLFTAVPKK